MRRAFKYYFIIFISINVYSQDVPVRGLPYLDTYMPEEYQNAGKIWDMQSNELSVLFLASDKGLLEFDGTAWKKYIGSKGFTRSLYIANDSLIYSGSDLDFGKWEKNPNLEYEYTSLYPFKENVGQITEEFWDVYQIMDFVNFISFNNIYVYKNDQLTKISAPYRFGGSHLVDRTLYMVDVKFGVYAFDGISLNLEFSYPENDPLQIVGIAKDKDELLIVTQNKGLFKSRDGNLYPWSTNLSDLLINDQAFSFTTINDEYYVFGTILNGIYITDLDGNIIQHINKRRGLANNTILDLHYSPNGMLWVSMDLGVTGIHLLKNLSYVFDHSGEFGTGYTGLIDDGTFYLGTNQGLYKSPWNNVKNDVVGTSFSLLPGSAGQVWSLLQLKDDIFCGHDKGLFLISEGEFISVNDQIGVLDIVAIDDDHILVGTYNGIHLYQNVENKWTYIHELNLIKGACSQILIDNNKVLWVHLPNYGIIKTELNSNLNVDDRTIYSVDLFSGELMYLIEDDKTGVNIITDANKYSFDPALNKIKKEPFVHQTDMVKHRLPMSNLPHALNDTFQFYPVYNGFALKQQMNDPMYSVEDTLILRKMEIFNRDTSFLHPYTEAIPHVYNNLKINTLIPHKENVAYRYYIDGYMEKWSDWTESSGFELLNLREGAYDLQVEGRVDNADVYHLSLPIVVKSPWYRTIYAYLGYLALLFLLFYSLHKFQNYKLEQQKKKLLEQEQESLRLQAENFKEESFVKKQKRLELDKVELEKELRSTKIQLVIKAKEDDDKKRVIKAFYEKLQSLDGDKISNTKKWKELYRIIDSHQEKENNTFQIQMDELNQAFTHKLKSTNPSLTMYDLRLCTYIKTGLSTREIAEMMHVLPSSINVSRSRLRKKLNLKAKDDLFSYLDGLESE